MNRRSASALVVASFFLGCVAGAGALNLYWGHIVPGRQIANLSRMQFWGDVLADVKHESGSYPASLEQALGLWKSRNRNASARMSWDPLQDNWGHHFRYARVRGGYILASFGRDGRCDVGDLLAYSSGVAVDESPCYAANSDTVLTAQGFMKGCGK